MYCGNCTGTASCVLCREVHYTGRVHQQRFPCAVVELMIYIIYYNENCVYFCGSPIAYIKFVLTRLDCMYGDESYVELHVGPDLKSET